MLRRVMSPSTKGMSMNRLFTKPTNSSSTLSRTSVGAKTIVCESYLSLLDRHIFVQCDSGISPEQSVHPHDLLALIFCVSRPRDGDSRSFPVDVDKVARGYCELLHRLIINSNLPMPNVSLLSVSYS